MQAEPWVARAQALLGGAVADDTVVLTRQERQVAAIVGTGHTNREAADQLFVSPRTIDFHLRNIYKKLGIRSRTELAVWLANRHTINDFPSHLDGTCYVVLDYQPYVSGPTTQSEREAAVEALPGSGRRVLFDDGRFQVWSPIGD